MIKRTEIASRGQKKMSAGVHYMPDARPDEMRAK